MEAAEAIVRQHLTLHVRHNLRVRMMAAESAVLELDPEVMQEATACLPRLDEAFRELGFRSTRLRAFKSGSVSRALGGRGQQQAATVRS